MANDNEQMLNKINEDYTDNLFKLAVNDAFEKDGKLLETEPTNEASENQSSHEQFEKFTRLLDSHLKKAKPIRKIKLMPKILNKVAVAMLALVILFSTAMLTVDAFRIRVLNLLISTEPKYTSFQLEDNNGDEQDNDNAIVNLTNTYVPTYVPEGYIVSNLSDTSTAKRITFSNTLDESLFLIYTEYTSANSIAVDTENASSTEKVNINDQNGTISVKDSIVSVAWVMDDHLFTVQGNLSNEEAIKIAEGVKFIK